MSSVSFTKNSSFKQSAANQDARISASYGDVFSDSAEIVIPRKAKNKAFAPIRAGTSADDVVDGGGGGHVNTTFEKHRLFATSFTYFHLTAFVLTYLCNLFIHASRKSLGNVKTVISEEWTPSSATLTERPKEPDQIWNSHTFFASDNDPNCKNFLGGLDTAFQASYAIGLFISGYIGDRFNLRYLLTISLVGNFATTFMFANVGEWSQLYSYFWYIPWWIANGFLQSAAYPCMLAILGNWFGKSHRGFIFGFWSTCGSVGNLLGSLLVGAVVPYGYDFAMLVPSVLLLSIASMIFFGVVASPTEVGLEAPKVDKSEKEDDIYRPLVSEDTTSNGNSYGAAPSEPPKIAMKEQPIGFFEAFLLPGVLIYSLAFACIKLVHYSFFYWLPYYLNRSFQWDATKSSNLASWYDVGGIFGAIIGGFASDKLRRSPVLAFMLICSLPLLFLYQSLPGDEVLNSVVLTLVGFFVGGVFNIISAAITADLGRQPKLAKNSSALSTITGIVDGIGSMGAALGQLLVPVIQDELGWEAVFYLFIICSFLTLICIMPIVCNELKEANVLAKLRQCYNQSGCIQNCCCCKCS